MTQAAAIPQTVNPSALATTRVAICIATHRRPDGLRRLLKALERLEFRASCVPSVEVIVVDNDSPQTAGLRVCEDIGSFRWELVAVAEERKGISFARNLALRKALGSEADVIVFIDDDEVPDACWLDALLQVQASSGAEAVAGPVLSEFEESVPAWIPKGKFFDRPRVPTGTAIKFAGAGNLLVTASFFRDSGLLFDERFGLSGGEDTLLSLQMSHRGARMIWADEAVARERVPTQRASARYIFRRSFAMGSNLARAERVMNNSLWTRARRGGLAFATLIQGATLLLPAIVLGRHAIVRSVARICRGCGALAGLFSLDSELYK